ncbi:acyl-coenzyme A synthetase/AMP-(fatty) acid ligase [Anoxybacillus voinovskiensis]|uniref:Acyl-coenzyme A synthetase/AMP-(Fatty) acid ligase n=1 Tax=Anoxybacteroides voinovskiense TaxID=230470 RepID=A0A840DQS5_9BACL|nr:AMP-binding protein [Anoxybacillus voinovskiensis]MBB4072388.1 acyl-coenzyme A synthetase/AMP-(fatty) acid ligase [Anoxybacillus voinovskiensis]GGJ58272.1 hypothetical protein GCM10008982_04240 [Anoxybacillus voinovskiensis]
MRGLYRWMFASEKLNWHKELLTTSNGSYSLYDIHQNIERYTTLLRQVGDISGKKVALLVPDVFHFFSVMLAINRLGGTVVPLNPFFERAELQHVLSRVNPHLVFTIKKYDRRKYFQAVYDWAHSIREETVIFETEDYQYWSTLVIRGDDKRLTEQEACVLNCSYADGILQLVTMDMGMMQRLCEKIVNALKLSSKDRVFSMMPIMSGMGACVLLSMIKMQLHLTVAEPRHWQEAVTFMKQSVSNKLLTTAHIWKKLRQFVRYDKNLDLKKFEFIGLTDRALPAEMSNMSIAIVDLYRIFREEMVNARKTKVSFARRGSKWLMLLRENR